MAFNVAEITNVIEEFVRVTNASLSVKVTKPALSVNPALSPIKADTLSPCCAMDETNDPPVAVRSQSFFPDNGQVQYRPFTLLDAAEYYELELQQIAEEARQKREQEENRLKREKEEAIARWAKMDSIHLHFGRGALPGAMKEHARNGLVKVVLGGKPGAFTKLSSGW